MKRTALLLALAMLAYGAAEACAQNNFRIGGRPAGSGRVTVNLNGGAGANPRFQIGGGQQGRLARARFGRFGNNFPVAVGYGGGCCGNQFFGNGGFSNLYNQGFIPVPPYYSLHPPVYYSVPVPRTYGYSPFAYPGTVMTPEVALGPEEIVNPHIEPEEVPQPAQEASVDKTAAAPLMIRNPFVEQETPVRLTADIR